MKKLFVVAMVLLLPIALVGCKDKVTTTVTETVSDGKTTETTTETTTQTLDKTTFTLDELAQYDGKDGRRAYIAVDGVVYDVTDLKAWKDGAHNGYEAGKDLTTEIKEKSPHGVAKLKEAPVVGELVK